MPNIYLAYIINAAGTRMGQYEFTQMCKRLKFDEQEIRIALTENGWRLDTEFGISMTEAVNMAFARVEYGNKVAS